MTFQSGISAGEHRSEAVPEPVLEVENLWTDISGNGADLHVVRGVSFSLGRGASVSIQASPPLFR